MISGDLTKKNTSNDEIVIGTINMDAPEISNPSVPITVVNTLITKNRENVSIQVSRPASMDVHQNLKYPHCDILPVIYPENGRIKKENMFEKSSILPIKMEKKVSIDAVSTPAQGPHNADIKNNPAKEKNTEAVVAPIVISTKSITMTIAINIHALRLKLLLIFVNIFYLHKGKRGRISGFSNFPVFD